ncbi:MAG: glutaredoxin domain-containing protein, partial [Candidatus Promineifilaceae bacterium]
VYGTPVCPMVTPVRSALKRANVEYTYVDIWVDDEARQQVRSINNGNESVPTLIFPDGSTLTEPSNKQLLSKLSSLGFAAAPPSMRDRAFDFLRSPTFRIAAMSLATFAIVYADVTLGVIAVTMGVVSYIVLPYLDS